MWPTLQTNYWEHHMPDSRPRVLTARRGGLCLRVRGTRALKCRSVDGDHDSGSLRCRPTFVLDQVHDLSSLISQLRVPSSAPAWHRASRA
jgi:hypothetical protein